VPERVPWFEIFPVFVVCHLTGDYLMQTEWQAVNKRGGLGPDPVARRALCAHVATYTLAYSPALIWLAPRLGAATVAVVALLAVPHLIQDDGRLIDRYMRTVKHHVPRPGDPLGAMVDQSFHVLALFGLALLGGALS
jgi:hypothetical protein